VRLTRSHYLLTGKFSATSNKQNLFEIRTKANQEPLLVW